MIQARPGVIVIATITFFTVIVMVNLILKVTVIVIVDKVKVIHYYFAITFCPIYKTFCQICHCTVKSHSPDWLLNQIITYNIVHY